MPTIALANNRGVVVFDEEDVELIGSRRWFLISPNGYAATILSGRQTLMHRMLMGPTEGQEVDHINGDRLDNRRANLRLCSRSQNLGNRRRWRSKDDGYKGV